MNCEARTDKVRRLVEERRSVQRKENTVRVKRTFRVIVTGGRAYQYREIVEEWLSKTRRKHPDLLVVHGNCPTGSDHFAREWCEREGVPHEPHDAQWNDYGPKAGPIRNSEIVDLGASGLIAFPGGNGTDDCVNKAKRAGIPCVEVE